MTTHSLDALLKIAEAATPGPWKAQMHDTERAGVAEIDGKGWQSFAEVYIARSSGETNPEGVANATHIATFHPTVAQALVRGMQVLEELTNQLALLAKDPKTNPYVQAGLKAQADLTLALKGSNHG